MEGFMQDIKDYIKDHMKDILLILFVIGLSIFLLKNPFNKKKQKDLSLLKTSKREITSEEKKELDQYINKYEKFAKYKIVSILGLALNIPLKYKKILKEKYPELSFPEFDNSIIHLEDKHIANYILEIARKKFGIRTKEELLKYDYEEHYHEMTALKNLIKEKALKEILEEIEPYVPEEERELYEKYKKGEEKFIFNF